jgi:AmmeMemoRadiSam system protein A
LRSPAPPDLAPDERQLLLDVARVALSVATGVGSTAELNATLTQAGLQPVGQRVGGAFVTLFEGDELRGCVGTLDPSSRLPQAVARAALLAARADPRFWPLQAPELPALRIEISVLGDMVGLDDPDSVHLGTEGVVVERGGCRRLLLPEVATELGWDAPRLWSAVCQKAGLPDDAWRDPTTHKLVFETVRFGGPAVP